MSDIDNTIQYINDNVDFIDCFENCYFNMALVFKDVNENENNIISKLIEEIYSQRFIAKHINVNQNSKEDVYLLYTDYDVEESLDIDNLDNINYNNINNIWKNVLSFINSDKIKKILFTKLEEYTNQRKQFFDDFKNNKIQKINFTELVKVLNPNQLICYYDSFNCLQCGVLKNYNIEHTWSGTTIRFSIYILNKVDDHFIFVTSYVYVNYFSGYKKISNLKIFPLTPENKNILDIRAKKYLEIYKNSNIQYLNYNGYMFLDSWFSTSIKSDAKGRIVLDETSYFNFNPDSSFQDIENRQSQNFIDIEGLEFLLPGVSFGYSLKTKKWGAFLIELCSPIQFNDNISESVELNKDIKDFLIKLAFNSNSFEDLIQSKSGGQIILLHGKSGTGKTLTAEMLAELKKTPIYHLSTGELGVDPKDVENKLDEILELIKAWNAILLIDECDIFLEKRTVKSDIIRNAIVSIFLKKLEYFDGIMILTTNRRESIDPAIFSRITVSISYSNLNQKQRFYIWKNLLNIQNHNLKISEEELLKLSDLPLNGRQIKNVIKNCLWINLNLTYDNLMKIIQLTVEGE